MSELIKRKDGSYSRRGLWDNIRANKGSKKKPTKEMLAQERKIKNMQDGGKLSYEEWKKKYNLKETNDYKLKRAWELGYVPDASGHLPTVDNQTLDFLKSGSHPTIKKELEWYNSPEGAEFKKKYQIDSTKQFWKYRPIVNNMESGGSIPERYRNMGFSNVGQKKESTNEGKKWMVLAKKGDQYKVVHGGYKGMQDFKQHGSEQRKENFWNRMGGRDSSKATDPFSPLYWHKRLGTWEQGGQLPQYQDGGWFQKLVQNLNPFGWFEDTPKTTKPVAKPATKPVVTEEPNREELPDVTVAKLLGAFNWGPGKIKQFLESQKAKGTDIYKSTNWVASLPKEPRDYINRALLKKDPVFQKQLERDTVNNPYVKLFGYGKDSEEYTGVLPQEVLLRVAGAESHFRKDIAEGSKKSPVGAEGLMQIMPVVLQQFKKANPGVNVNLKNPKDNLRVANWYFKWLSERPYLNKSETSNNIAKKEKGGIMNKLGDVSQNRRNLLKQGIATNLYPLPFAKGGKMYKQGGIFIKPENRGKFTAWAKSKGMGVQEAASKVMANKEEYSPTIVKRANFAKNAAGWNKAQGGRMAMNYNLGNMNIEPKSYAQGGGIDNPGFKALPDFVQAKIKANMESGGVMRYRMGGKTKFSKMC